MTSSFEISGGRVLGLNNGESFFDTDAYPVQFYPPEEKIIITGRTISFPDFHHANAYGFAAGDTGGGVIRQSCQSFVTIPFQEWGPPDTPAATDILPDVVIGTVPSGTDVRLVRVKLTRTKVPDQINGNTIPVEPQEGERVNAEGGSLLVEFLWPVARMVWIRLATTPNGDGTTNILLSRKQSVIKRRYAYWRLGNSPNNSGWTYGGTNGPYGHIVKRIESKGPAIAIGGVITFRRGDGAQCSLTDTSDFSSDYIADIEILPGRSNIVPESSGGGGIKVFMLADSDGQNPVSGSHTYEDKFIGVEPNSEQTRHVIVAITGYRGAETAARDITGVTIGGVVATQVAHQRRYVDTSGSNDQNWVGAIYIAEVPTGDTADIVATWNASFWSSEIDVYAAYNLDSPTPVSVVQGQTIGTFPLQTSPEGFAVAVYRSGGWTSPTALTGIDNLTSEGLTWESPSLRQSRRIRGFQDTTGADLSIEVDVVDHFVYTVVSFV